MVQIANVSTFCLKNLLNFVKKFLNYFTYVNTSKMLEIIFVSKIYVTIIIYLQFYYGVG